MLLGSRISLGPFVPEDSAAVFCWINDVAAARLDFAYRPVDMMAHQQWWNGLGKDPTKVVFALRKTSDPALIGFAQITGINSVHRCAELGIRIGEEKNRGQGYGKEALRLALDFCWNHLNLNRVQLVVFKHNARAIEAYKAAGFRREGCLKKAACLHRRRVGRPDHDGGAAPGTKKQPRIASFHGGHCRYPGGAAFHPGYCRRLTGRGIANICAG